MVAVFCAKEKVYPTTTLDVCTLAGRTSFHFVDYSGAIIRFVGYVFQYNLRAKLLSGLRMSVYYTALCKAQL